MHTHVWNELPLLSSPGLLTPRSPPFTSHYTYNTESDIDSLRISTGKREMVRPESSALDDIEPSVLF